jgi:hypothetical protein
MRSKSIGETSISRARSVQEIGAFWDTHSLADYRDQTYEVEFEVRAQRKRRAKDERTEANASNAK